MQDKLENHGQLNCTDCDQLLAEAVDDRLTAPALERFRMHAEACATCGPLFTLAKAGRSWLRQLEEAEPPANLVHNILAVTSLRAAETGHTTAAADWRQRLSGWFAPRLAPALRGMMQPRFAMTAAMAFFSVTMVLSVTGVKASQLRNVDLRPNSIWTNASIQYHETTAKLIRYYENNRLVYKLESQVKAFKAATANSDEPGTDNEKSKPQPPGKDPHKKTPGDPKNEQNQNYTFEQDGSLMAMDRATAPMRKEA